MDDLIKQNIHWKGNSFKLPPTRRDIFNDVIKDLNKDPISLISGPRRVGKSVLLKQIIEYLINEQRVHPKQILYFEFSPESKKDDLEEVFNVYTAEVCNPQEKFYLFFDEFLRLNNDSEYTNYTEAKSRLFEDKLFASGVAERLRYKFEQFLKFKRLPEPASYEDEEKCALYNKSVLEQTLSQDAMSYFSIGLPKIFINLFYKLALSNGSEVSVKSLSEKTFGVGMATLSTYLDVMEIMGLLYVVRNTTDPLKSLNSNKKMYVSSHYSGAETDLGHLVESYILERFLSQGKIVTYYRKREKEIDFLIPSEKLAVEVKFTSKFGSNDFKTLNSFCNDRGYSPMVVSLSTAEKYVNTLVVPAIFV